jgi:hypothetical protein
MFIELHTVGEDVSEAFVLNTDSISQLYINRDHTTLYLADGQTVVVAEPYADLKKALNVTQIINPVEVPA